MKQINVLVVFGTRPEAIKLASLINKMKRNERIKVFVCVTAQHRTMLDQVLNLFGIIPDYDLNIMKENQNLFDVTGSILRCLPPIMDEVNPDCVVVHGDTTTAFSVALAAYYKKIPVAHVEAGLRTGNIYSPWPEEMNRRLVSEIADLHFSPTDGAMINLLKENVNKENVFVTGNTVIDTLLDAKKIIESDFYKNSYFDDNFPFIRNKSRMVLITGHRRENFGEGFRRICQAINRLATSYPDVDFVYPVHLNPNVKQVVSSMLSGIFNIHLIDPQEYINFVYLMNRCSLILTDSGGIQEEAPSLCKPVIVLRENTERPEALLAGTARLSGTDENVIVQMVSEVLDGDNCGSNKYFANPYGDGFAGEKIINLLIQRYGSVN